MRALILGAGGLLGRALTAAAPAGVATTSLAHAELDITDAAALATALTAARPTVVFNAAGYTAVDRAEHEPALAHRVNAVAVGELGRIAARVGVRVIHFGTDYVFDGRRSEPYREDDAPNPLSAYGRSKLGGEQALRDSGADYLIVRTQWLFGLGGRSFPRTMWERASEGVASRVVDDQVGRPTFAPDLARAVWALAARESRGVVHVANAGTATWYGVARLVYERAGRPALVTPCATGDYPSAAARPARAVLDTTRAEGLLGGPLPPWEDALDRFLKELLGATAGRPAFRGSGSG